MLQKAKTVKTGSKVFGEQMVDVVHVNVEVWNIVLGKREDK